MQDERHTGLRLRLSARLLVLLAAMTGLTPQPAPATEPAAAVPRDRRELAGWTVMLSRRLSQEHPEKTAEALRLLELQLDEIVRVVPQPAVAELRKVVLWISPEYPGVTPRAEYHPGADWLRKNDRDPAMVKGVEFTNVLIFAAETKRMPNFALHELAHAYHDRVLPGGFEHGPLREVFAAAKAGGRYDRVEQRFGDGRRTETKAYALTNPAEYFAECSEAYFSTNDFYPFNRVQLREHDPRICELLERLWQGPPAE